MSDPKDCDLDTYPAEYVFRASKTDILAYIDFLRAEIELGPEVAQFPEGVMGAVVHAMVKLSAAQCADLGEFALARQGFELVLRASFESVKATFALPPPST